MFGVVLFALKYESDDAAVSFDGDRIVLPRAGGAFCELLLCKTSFRCKTSRRAGDAPIISSSESAQTSVSVLSLNEVSIRRLFVGGSTVAGVSRVFSFEAMKLAAVNLSLKADGGRSLNDGGGVGSPKVFVRSCNGVYDMSWMVLWNRYRLWKVSNASTLELDASWWR